MNNEKMANVEISTMSTEEILQLVSPTYNEVVNNGEVIKVRVVNISPELAEILLSRNANNRPINNQNVTYIVKEIANGNWKLNGESIKIDKEGNLIDGQHRLAAIIKSSTTLSMFIMSGFNSDVFTVLDVGRKRQGSDALSIHGVLNASVAAATIKHINQFVNGSYSETGSASRTISNQKMVDFYNENPEIAHSVTFGKKYNVGCNGILTPSLIAAFHFLFSKKSVADAETFLSKLCTGVGLESDSPINVLRNRLISSKTDARQSLKQSGVVKYTITAWNKYRRNERCKLLRVIDDVLIIE